MNQKEYTFSNKDRKFLSALMLFHFSLVMMTVSFFGLYYKDQVQECKRLTERLDLADWAKEEVNKAQSEQRIESIKTKYRNQGIDAEEF